MSDARLFAATWPGLETAAAEEAREAGFADVQAVPGGVNLRGDALRANRMLAVPNRILQRVARFPAHDFDRLVKGAAAVDWSPFGGLTPSVTCRKSRLYHSGAVAERLAGVVPPGPGRLFARLSRDRCTLSVDTTGELAHRRGWRLETGRAPLRVAFTRRGDRALVTCVLGGELMIFDATQPALLAEVSIHGDRSEQSSLPLDVVSDPDGRRAYVTCARGEFVAVIDLQRAALIDRIDARRGPDGLAYARPDR